MSLKTFVLDALQPLENGRTVTTTCPVCGTRGKFTATVKDDVVLYNCYRNSCISGGKFLLDLSAEERITRLKRIVVERDRPVFLAPSYWIDGIGDDRCVKYLESMHMMVAYDKGLFRPMYDPAEQRFIFPIKDETGKVENAVGRTLINAFPKAYIYNSKVQVPFVCGRGSTLLLVEDCASAVAATRIENTSGMALMGTKIRISYIKYMASYQKVIVALDKDATASSFILQKYLTTYLKDVRIRKLDKDIKDMSDAEYAEWYAANAM